MAPKAKEIQRIVPPTSTDSPQHPKKTVLRAADTRTHGSVAQPLLTDALATQQPLKTVLV
jgi:hypothetical protein